MTRVFGIAALVGVGLVALLGAFAPWSPSGWFALGAAAIAAIALVVRDRGARRGLAIVATILFAVLLGVRVVGSESGMIRMLTLPAGTPSRWIARLVDEQDVALMGARALAQRWPLAADEKERLLPAMHDAYVAMRRDDVVTPSPVADTLLGRQKPDGFDALVIEPRTEPQPAPKYGVLFLHGYAGSHTLECWLVAKAAQTVGAVTVCPATEFSGHWRGPAAERIVRTGLDYLYRRGITRVFLAGLSNGAAGASALAPSFASSLSGLMLISGAPANGGTAGLPTLVVHGTDDAIASVASAQAFVARAHARYASFPGGHFVLLVRREETRKVMADWLMEQLGLHEGGKLRRP
jgi:pimeloyl-ACP methyl ester carboxylesterase